jgi:hypothetical protein
MSVQLAAVGKLKKLKDRNAIPDLKNEIITNYLQTVTSFPSMDLMQNTQICEMLPLSVFKLASAMKMTFGYCGGVCGSD